MSIGVDVSDKCTPAECYVLDRSALVTLLAYLHTRFFMFLTTGRLQGIITFKI